jgi:LysM repeat protein
MSPSRLAPPPNFAALKVLRGDTLGALSRRVGVSVAELAKCNALKNPDELEAGQSLKIPLRSPALEVRVGTGDTLSSLAGRLGSSSKAIAAANGLDVRALLQPGQVLRVLPTPWAPPGRGDGKATGSWQPSTGGKVPVAGQPAQGRGSSEFEGGPSTPLTGAQVRAGTGGQIPISPSGSVNAGSWVATTPPSGGPVLRYASAVTSGAENAVKLSGRALRGAGLLGAAVSAARLPGDVQHLCEDLARPGHLEESAEDGAKAGRNTLKVVRGVEEVAEAVGARTLARIIPGASAVAAALDVGLAAAAALNPRASTQERLAADLAAAGSSVAALSIPVVSQVAALASVGVGLWRDELSDERRAAEAARSQTAPAPR